MLRRQPQVAVVRDQDRRIDWEVRIPGAHKPVSQHRSLDDAKREAREFVAKAGGGEVMILV